MRIFFSFFLLLLLETTLIAQTTITGQVKDSKTGAPLNGVDIVVVGKPLGTFTNSVGKFNEKQLAQGLTV